MNPWHKNMVVLTGLVLIVLGVGNWATGEVRLREHESLISTIEQRASGPPATEKRRNTDEDDEELELARVRMDFYHVVASGGRLLTAAGVVLTAIGLARRLRLRAKIAHHRPRRAHEPG